MYLFSRCVLFSITLAALSTNSSCFALSTARSAPQQTNHQLLTSSTSSFWDDPQLVQSLPDPPSDELLKLIQAKPYRGGFEPAREIDHETYPPYGSYSPRIVYGSIPQDLTGSLATNGPGRIRIRGRQYGHWFDGDGFVTLLNIDGQKGTATFQAKYVKTKRYKAQQKLMEKLFIDCDDSSDEDANLFKEGQRKEELKYKDDSPPLAFTGPWTPGGKGQWYENLFRIPTNPANTSTMWLPSSLGQGKRPRLYALCEGGSPIELDPLTLDTLQNGDETPFTSSDGRENTSMFFSAHFSHCPQTGDIYNHGYCLRPGPLQKEINIMKLNKFGDVLQQKASPLPFDSFVHDSVISQNYMVYFLPPYYIPMDSIFQFLAGQSPLGKLSEWDPNIISRVHVHCKDDLELKWVIDLPNAMSMYHLVDAHELEHIGREGKNQIEGEVMLAVRVLEHEPVDREGLERQFADQYRVEDPRLVANLKEYIFHLGPDGVSSLVSCKDVADGAAECEYPALNNSFDIHKRRRYCWTNAASTKPTDWLDGIQKVNMQEGTSSRVATFGEGSYAGAPSFVPRNNKDERMPAEDDGFIITTVYRALEHRSDVAVLDAATLDLLCLMELEHHVPYQFHGDFLEGVLCRV